MVMLHPYRVRPASCLFGFGTLPRERTRQQLSFETPNYLTRSRRAPRLSKDKKDKTEKSELLLLMHEMGERGRERHTPGAAAQHLHERRGSEAARARCAYPLQLKPHEHTVRECAVIHVMWLCLISQTHLPKTWTGREDSRLSPWLAFLCHE